MSGAGNAGKLATMPDAAPAPRDPPELHFFPGAHQLLWVVGGKVALRAEAWGGEQPARGVHYDVMKPRPTTPGRFVVRAVPNQHVAERRIRSRP